MLPTVLPLVPLELDDPPLLGAAAVEVWSRWRPEMLPTVLPLVPPDLDDPPLLGAAAVEVWSR